MAEVMVNPFDEAGFGLAELCGAINILPNNYGLIGKKNLFPDKGVTTRTVIFEEQNGVLNLLQSMPVGSPGTQAKRGKRKVRSFVIPHIPHDDVILAGDLQGLRAFGSASQTSPLVTTMNNRLASMKAKHDITREHLRMGALKGIILDADGSTLYNLYTEFGITQKTVNFALTTEATEVKDKCMEVVRHIEDNLQGEVMTGVECLCSEEFYDALTSHTSVKAAFANYQEAKNRLGGDMRSGFEFGGIVFQEYRGKATDADGNVRRFIAANQAHFYPVGTMEAFATFNAPADFMETVGTLGLPYYAKQQMKDFNRGVDIHTQSNPLPMCVRPGVLVKGTKS